MNGIVKELKYSFYLTTHPFKGFWGIKHEKMGSIRTAIVWLVLFLISSVANGFYSGFLFNKNGGINFNLYQSIGIILLVFFLWCISNWCLTSLFDGEGRFIEIFIAASYALLPMAITQLLLIPLSHSFSMQEASFYTMIFYIGLFWSAFLLLIGTIVTHQYSFGKTIVIIICTFLGMSIITYIMLLFFNLIQQVLGFGINFWKELMLRIS